MFKLRWDFLKISPLFLFLFLVSGVFHVLRIRLMGYQIDIVYDYIAAENKAEAQLVFVKWFTTIFSISFGLEAIYFFWSSFEVYLFETCQRHVLLKYEAKFLHQLHFLSAAVEDHDAVNMKLFSKYKYDLSNLLTQRFFVFVNFLKTSTRVLIILVQIFIIHYLIALFTLPLFFSLLIPWLFEKRLSKRKVEISEARGEFTYLFEETISSLQTLLFNGKEKLLDTRTRTISKRFADFEKSYELRKNLISWLQSHLQGLFSCLVVVLVLLISIRDWAMSTISIGSVAIIFTYFQSLIINSENAISDLLELKTTKPIEQLLSLPKEIDIEPKKIEIPTLIEAANISLERRERKLFGSLSFSLAKGKGYLVTGESGVGKTTLLKLIMGLIKNYKGSLTFDKKDHKRIPEITLRESIAWMPASNQIFKGNVEENITMWDQKVNLERYKQSIRLANLERELAEIEERQLSCEELSEGQKQRVSLARTFYLNRSILLLDEPFANLDKRNVRIIVKRLLDQKILEKRLIVITSHTEIEALAILLERIHIVGNKRI